jgi:gliding motility-associated-like protein
MSTFAGLHAQIQIAFQGAESGDSWSYTSTAVSTDGTFEATQSPNIVSGSQSLVVGGVAGGGSCISGGSGNGPVTLNQFTFSEIDISTSSQYTRELTFNFGNRLPVCTGTGWDTGENLVFTPIFDGVVGSPITVFTGAGNISVDINQNQFFFQVPSCVGTFGFTLGISTNRNDEFLFVDNVELTAPQVNGPIPSFTAINGPLQACTGTTSIFSTDEFAGINYNWFDIPSTSTFITPNDSSISDSITIDWGTTLPGTYTISVSPTDACGLLSGDPISFTFELVDNPQPLIITGPDSICQGASANLVSNYVTGNVWSTSEITQSISVSQSGTYSVSVTGVCGILQSSVTIAVISQPNASISVNGNLSLCPGQSVQLISSTNQDFTWSDLSLNDTLTTSNAGTYILSVANFCGLASDTVEVLSIPGIIQPQILSSGSVLCVGSSLILISSEVNGISWSTGSVNDSIDVTTAGTYILSVNNGCGIGADTLEVSSSVFSFNAQASPDSGNAPLEVDFLVNSSDPISSYTWDFNGLGSSSEIAPLFTFNEPGVYPVIVDLVDQNGCVGTDTIEIRVLPKLPSEITVPNCFSPNGDGFNDLFKVESANLSTFDLMIWNRWGGLMYKSTDAFAGWNGQNNSGIAPDGTYFYVLDAVGSDSKAYQFKGSITLSR